MTPGKRRARIILPGLYLVLAIYTWIEFTLTNHDGLANVWLFLITLPMTLIFLMLGQLVGSDGILMPQGHGYLGDHALYFVPAVAVMTLLLWWIGGAIDRRRG